MDAESPSKAWRVGPTQTLALDQPRIMGILNVTPDSFSDGGIYASSGAAIDAALCLKTDGACIIDVGGESTRPGSRSVDGNEQTRRVVPVIAGIRAKYDSDDVLVSIDTTQAAVAKAALDAGADIINDTSAGRDDENMLPLAASRGCGLILMHRLKRPSSDSYSTGYPASQVPNYGNDIVKFISHFLNERCDHAIQAGVNPNAIVIDPGFGFGKTVEQNYELAGRISEFGRLSYPVLSAASRKSFIGAASGETNPSQRVMESVAISIAHWMAGVRLFRVHDVLEHIRALRVVREVGKRAKPQAARR